MPEIAQTSLARRMLYTPLRDWIRGRLNVRLDWRGRIAAADLPKPAKELIGRVVKRTRLWRLEKADVGEELIAHFRDALESGEMVESAIRFFGDERQAAKLIRRGKKRNRPIWWQSLIWLRQGIIRVTALLLVVYAILAVRFYWAHPSPKIDYVAEMNRELANAPESERAWPLYRQAILGMFEDRRDQNGPDLQLGSPEWMDHDLDGTHWPEAQQWLRQHQPQIAMVCQAAKRKVFGFVFGEGGSLNDPKLFAHDVSVYFKDGGPVVDGIDNLEVPHLRYARYLADILQADAKLAILDHDGSRLERDINAIHGIATQVRGTDQPRLFNAVALNLDFQALDSLDRAITSGPQILSDEQLNRLSRLFATPQSAADLLNLRGDRSFQDMVQRVYSDDGNGDGRITSKGWESIMIAGADLSGIQNENFYSRINLMTIGPIVAPFVASRKEIMERYDRLVELDETDLHLTLRSLAEPAVQKLMAKAKTAYEPEFKYGILYSVSYLIRDPRREEEYLGQRDGLLTGIALELYHRRRGGYPETLAELTPTYLASVPPDRFTGEPIKYRLVSGRPLFYSVGANRIDDGGLSSEEDQLHATKWDVAPDKAGRGDWVLFPMPRYPTND